MSKINFDYVDHAPVSGASWIILSENENMLVYHTVLIEGNVDETDQCFEEPNKHEITCKIALELVFNW